MTVYRLTYTIAIEDGAFESVRDSTLVLADSASDARDAIDIQVERVGVVGE